MILYDEEDVGVNQHGFTNVFDGKVEQMKEVHKFIEKTGLIPPDVIQDEVEWFYNKLGLDGIYFSLESAEGVARHVMALYASKIFAYARNEEVVKVNLQKEDDNGALFIHNSKPGTSHKNTPKYEKKICGRYLDVSNKTNAYRLDTYRSKGTISSSNKTQLRCYLIMRCDFPHPNQPFQETDILRIASKLFLSRATKCTIDLHQEIIRLVVESTGPVIKMVGTEDDFKKILVIGYPQNSSENFFASLSDLYHHYGLFSTEKHVENFSNGVTVMSIYLTPLSKDDLSLFKLNILHIVNEVSLIYCIPNTPFHDNFCSGKLDIRETIYGYCALVFTQHFVNRLGGEYLSLKSVFDHNNSSHLEILDKIKKRFREDTYSKEYVIDIINRYPELLKLLYMNFALVHYVDTNESPNSQEDSPSFGIVSEDGKMATSEHVLKSLRDTVGEGSREYVVFETMLIFNEHILKTNFYMSNKTAISFRLDPSFILSAEYPQKPFGVFLMVGNEFRGFHIRFRDIARGGVRIIKSRNRESYNINFRLLFDENYSLAHTQQLKNKDIPEGGSKGTILLDFAHQDKACVAFEKYISSLIDLIVDNPQIVDKYGKKEMIFLGPDEGSAEYMDFTSQYAKKRRVFFWNAISTGKSPSLGGIPHDVFGMTTRSVKQYESSIYRKLGLKEENIIKLQTGGPDGDLGSNEIKMSKDKTTGIVDGSGVLYDPCGIDREELLRLANMRDTISHFDIKKLSTQGFQVLIDQKKIQLPDGTCVDDGLVFRNEFHLSKYAKCDMFVPCGGRPESVNLGNVGKILREDGCLFKYIVEGANLFFTQEARDVLEDNGVIIFKDSSANKGGVTSSSLEVLVALSLTDKEFYEHMQTKNGKVPEFYKKYVENIHCVIDNNTLMEFECIWREHERTGRPRSILCSEISEKIVALRDEIPDTKYWDDVDLRYYVLMCSLPKVLQETVGLENIISRVPEVYLKAIFASYLASQFVYKHGVGYSEFSLSEFMIDIMKESRSTRDKIRFE